MKRKLFFLCTLLALGAGANSNEKNDTQSINNENNEILEQHNFGSVETFKNGKKNGLSLGQIENVGYEKFNDAKPIGTSEQHYVDLPYYGKILNDNNLREILKSNAEEFTEPVKCKNCDEVNNISLFAPDDIECVHCGKPVRYKVETKIQKACINCGAINTISETAPDNVSCEDCGCWLNYRVWHCNSGNCKNAGAFMSYDESEMDCDSCHKKKYQIKKCLNCNCENKVFLNYKREEVTFSKETYELATTNCLHCKEPLNYSKEYTFFKIKLSYKTSYTEDDVETFESHPMVGYKIRMFCIYKTGFEAYAVTDNDGNAIFKVKSNDIPWNILTWEVVPNSEGINVGKLKFKLDGQPEVVSYRPTTIAQLQFEINNLGKINKFPDYEIDMMNDSYEKRAVVVGHDAYVAREFAKEMLKKRQIEIEDIDIAYPCDSSTVDDILDTHACYWPLTHMALANLVNPRSRICISETWEYNTRTVFHEYGHHVQFQKEININGQPSIFNGHFGNENHFSRFLTVDQARKLAWGEAWPDVFAELARCYNEGKKANEVSSYLENNDSTRGYIYNHDTNKTEIDPKTGEDKKDTHSGDGCELTIEQILWDIFDDVNNDGDVDNMSLDYQKWFDITTKKDTTTFLTFYLRFCEEYPHYQSNIDDLLKQHEIKFIDIDLLIV